MDANLQKIVLRDRRQHPTLSSEDQLILDAEIMRRFGSDPTPPEEYSEACDFWKSACEGMLKYETKWKQFQNVFAWIDEKPAWVSASSWDQWLENPTTPCTRRFQLELIGGGQIRLFEDFKRFVYDGEPSPFEFISCIEPRLRVQAHVDATLRTYSGVLSHGPIYEMTSCAVVFPRGTPQDIADRTAKTLRLIGGDPDNFYALLARGERCGCCGRGLTDEVSRLTGVGPDCARRICLPQDIEYANHLLKLRRELLGG
jgi:Family of unknown function (DUF6011)